MSSSPRDTTVDTLRGLAIVTMVSANLASLILPEPHPLWFRLYGSFAAPIFIALAGMMVTVTSRSHGHSLRYFAARGAMLMGLAALIDITIWHIAPFTSVDVLYLIGLSLPLASLLACATSMARWTVPIAVFAVTPALQSFLGYASYPTEIYLWRAPAFTTTHQTGILNHWLVDGWFPVFPWLGFSLLGACLGHARRGRNVPQPGFFRVGAPLLMVGVAIWWSSPGPLLSRLGASETFYPPTMGYVLTAAGLFLALFVLDACPDCRALTPLRALGESSLTLYVLHLVLIRYAARPLWPSVSLPEFALVYAALVAILVCVAYGVRQIRRK